MKRIVLALTIFAVTGPGVLQAQSLFSAAGLGIPMEALDGRSRALGNLGIGLLGPEISATDPAALGLMVAPTAIFTSQPSWVNFDHPGGGDSGSFHSTRFPLVGVAYPAWKLGMMALTFSSFLDQRFQAQRPVTLELSDGEVDATDSFVSDGGVSRVNLTWGHLVGRNFGVGLSVGRYSGRVLRRLVRTFEEIDVDGTAQPYQAGGRWSYSGTMVTGGGSVRFGQFARIAGSVTWSGTLQAQASEDTPGADASYDLPVEVRIGASALLAPSLMISASYSSADWTATGADLSTGSSVGNATNYGFGLELSRASLLGKRAPLRFGYRSGDLPFKLAGGAATETAFTGGVGLILNEQAGLILASIDLGVERGERKDLTLVEKFWRATLTLRVAGF